MNDYNTKPYKESLTKSIYTLDLNFKLITLWPPRLLLEIYLTISPFYNISLGGFWRQKIKHLNNLFRLFSDIFLLLFQLFVFYSPLISELIFWSLRFVSFYRLCRASTFFLLLYLNCIPTSVLKYFLHSSLTSTGQILNKVLFLARSANSSFYNLCRLWIGFVFLLDLQILSFTNFYRFWISFVFLLDL